MKQVANHPTTRQPVDPDLETLTFEEVETNELRRGDAVVDGCGCSNVKLPFVVESVKHRPKWATVECADGSRRRLDPDLALLTIERQEITAAAKHRRSAERIVAAAKDAVVADRASTRRVRLAEDLVAGSVRADALARAAVEVAEAEAVDEFWWNFGQVLDGWTDRLGRQLTDDEVVVMLAAVAGHEREALFDRGPDDTWSGGSGAAHNVVNRAKWDAKRELLKSWGVIHRAVELAPACAQVDDTVREAVAR